MNRRDAFKSLSLLGTAAVTVPAVTAATLAESDKSLVHQLADEAERYNSKYPTVYSAASVPMAVTPPKNYYRKFHPAGKEAKLQPIVDQLRSYDSTLLTQVFTVLWERHRPKGKNISQVDHIPANLPNSNKPAIMVPGTEHIARADTLAPNGVWALADRIVTPQLVLDSAELNNHYVAQVLHAPTLLAHEWDEKLKKARQVASTAEVKPNRMFAVYESAELHISFDAYLLSIFASWLCAGTLYRK